MPEITSVEKIRAKLREFEERIDGAIAAANTLNRIKSDAEQLTNKIKFITMESSKTQHDAAELLLTLQEIQNDWEKLNSQFHTSFDEIATSRERLLRDYDSTVAALDDRVTQAEERLKTTNAASLADQAKLLKQIETNTRINADNASRAVVDATEEVEKLKQLLSTVEIQLQNEVHTHLKHTEDLLNTKIANVETGLHSQIESFRCQMKEEFSSHEQSLDRKITDFLSKQNVLVQNLTQHVDSMQRAAQSVSAESSKTKTEFNELLTAFGQQRNETMNELNQMKKYLTAASSPMSALHSRVLGQDEVLKELRREIQEAKEQFDKLAQQLKSRSWFTGVK